MPQLRLLERERPWRVTTSFLATMLMCQTVLAADGDLDPSFGIGGVALSGPTGVGSDSATKPVTQSDGKVLYCSRFQSSGGSGLDFYITRFDADGALDATFDFDGRVKIDFDGGDDACHGIAVQADGKIVAVGWTHPQTAGASDDFAIARLNADGSLDTTFGAGTGKATVAFDLSGDNADQAHAIALQPDGKIVVAGSAVAGVLNAYDFRDFAVTRLSQDGTRDSTFSLDGRATIHFDLPPATNTDAAAYAVAVDSVGRIVLSGRAGGDSGGDFAVARLLSNGDLDDAFDADGRATVAFDVGASFDDGVSGMTLDRRGRIVLAGYADTGTSTTTSYDIAMTRLLQDGSLDASFGFGGQILIPYDIGGINSDLGYGVLEDQAGRLVVAGTSISDTEEKATLTRLRPDGSLDAQFGFAGKKIIDFGADYGSAYGVALQGTQLILAGERFSSDIEDFVARLEVDLLFADGFD